ncbi:MAG: OsmC family peroxiredoxin [Cyclobacteriaceae bacterium]|nr:OsmC family peroxiredoxin [Cyclobacteriaceae bacterium]
MIADEVYEASNDNNNKVLIDMRKREDKKHQSPVELLLSALAACGAVDVVVVLKKRKKSILDCTIETEGQRREETPRAFTKINCHYIITSEDATEEEVEKAAGLALEKYCSVASSLSAEITYSVQVIRPN